MRRGASSMKSIVLSTMTESGNKLEAAFNPEVGMNLTSYKLDDIEVIDQSTRKNYETSRNGLGALIGPHFHERPSGLIPNLNHVFLHQKYLEKRKKTDIFSHGVGRYASWKTETKGNSIHAQLCGEDTLEEVPLSEIEGQNFKMRFDAELTPKGLKLDLSVVSERDSVVGYHYYYSLGKGQSRVRASIQNYYLLNIEKMPLPKEWDIDSRQQLTYPIGEDIDCTLFPYPNLLEGEIALETDSHHLIIRTNAPSSENSWQLWHPEGASFACIEPISAQNPRRPNLTVSSISCLLSISTPKAD